MKRFTRIGTIFAAVAAAGAAIWALRDRIIKPKPVVPVEPTKGPAAPPAEAKATKAAEAPHTPAEVPDDLTVVKGIGPVYRARLTTAGITSFGSLAAADPADIAAAAEVPETRARDWVTQAAGLAGH